MINAIQSDPHFQNDTVFRSAIAPKPNVSIFRCVRYYGKYEKKNRYSIA